MSGAPHLLIRADATPEIGLGHVMRCLALAQEWQDRGGAATFLCAGLVPGIRDRALAEGFSVEDAAGPRGSADDAAGTAALAAALGSAWVVVDGYAFDQAYVRLLKSAGLSVLQIDDLGFASPCAADLVLNQNASAAAALYPGCTDPDRLLLGTRYALLRREYAPWRNWRRPIAAVAGKILVSFGGSDPADATGGFVEAWLGAGGHDAELMVVVGAGNPRGDRIAGLAARRPDRITVVRAANDMSERMAWADIAVVAGGSTLWELCFMGLPAVVVATAENQGEASTAVARAGACVFLGAAGAVRGPELAAAVARLCNDPEARGRISLAGRSLVDGLGCGRVASRLLEPAAPAARDAASSAARATLRRARSDDARQVWRWANDPVTRAASFSSAEIPWEGHLEWFAGKVASESCLFLVAEAPGGAGVGQVRFEREGDLAVISVSIAPEMRGAGLGRWIIEEGCRRACGTWPLRVIHAFIKPGNAPSLRVFAAAGFRPAPEPAAVNGQEAVLYVRRCNPAEDGS